MACLKCLPGRFIRDPAPRVSVGLVVLAPSVWHKPEFQTHQKWESRCSAYAVFLCRQHSLLELPFSFAGWWEPFRNLPPAKSRPVGKAF